MVEITLIHGTDPKAPCCFIFTRQKQERNHGYGENRKIEPGDTEKDEMMYHNS